MIKPPHGIGMILVRLPGNIDIRYSESKLLSMKLAECYGKQKCTLKTTDDDAGLLSSTLSVIVGA